MNNKAAPMGGFIALQIFYLKYGAKYKTSRLDVLRYQ
jgi:hypothetical protein